MRHILEMFGEPITYGGQESVVYNMLSMLDLKNDFNVDLFTPYYADNKQLIELIESNNGKIYHKDKEFKIGDNRFLLTEYIEDFFNDVNKIYDVVHIHTGSLSTMCMYSKIAKKHGVKKVIVHAHIAGDNNEESVVHKIQKYILCLMLKKYVDVYVGCSKKAIDFKWVKSISKKAILVNNGINIEKYKFDEIIRDEIKEKYKLKDKIVIGNVARFSRQKNHIFMIEVFKRLLKENNNIVFMFVGDGEEKTKIEDMAIDSNVNDNILFIGNVNDAYKYYNAFDIFILPSLYEGLPVTAIEAQVNQLPVLISDTITNECNISNATKFLPLNNMDEWKNNIMQYANMIQNGKFERKSIKVQYEKYDRKNTYKIIDKIYKDNL